jgi:hypothetical protein
VQFFEVLFFGTALHQVIERLRHGIIEGADFHWRGSGVSVWRASGSDCRRKLVL